MVDTNALEKKAMEFLAAGDKDGAISALYELGLACAKVGDFDKADFCKQKIYKLDAMALTEIVGLGEIIDEEKAGSLDTSCIDMWPELYQALGNDETNALLYALKEKSFEPNEILFKQGMRNGNLYFVISGQLKLIHGMESRQLFLKTLSNGDIAGEDTFFKISTCTTSLVTVSRVKVKYLERSILEELSAENPGLESKLADYAANFEKVPDLLKEKGFDRRQQERYEISGLVLVDLLNAEGKPLGKKFKGKLADISNGGLSFQIKTAQKKTARLLLGRRVKLHIQGQAADLTQELEQFGRVTSVGDLLFNDYSVHVGFDAILAESILSDLISHLKIKR